MKPPMSRSALKRTHQTSSWKILHMPYLVRRALLAVALLGFIAAAPAYAHETLKLEAPKPLLAPTPPMGWNSWNKFACNINEALVRKQADAMVASGMKDAGYQYIVIDDCWQKSRDADGNIVADPERFPGGIKALVDYVHSKGLKFGLYSDAGALTCGGRPGSAGHEFQDARQYKLQAGSRVEVSKHELKGGNAAPLTAIGVSPSTPSGHR